MPVVLVVQVASVVLEVLAVLEVWVALAVLAAWVGVVVQAHRNYRPAVAATAGNTTRSIAEEHHTGIARLLTGLAVRLAGTRSPTARLERDSR